MWTKCLFFFFRFSIDVENVSKNAFKAGVLEQIFGHDNAGKEKKTSILRQKTPYN